MSSSGGLTSTPLRQDVGFNWVFLIELGVCGIIALFFLFYFNRVFATLVSYGIRAWTWHKYRVYIDIQSLQISLLAGRIFFRGVKYHGNNETILIHNGYVTWIYWVRNVRELDLGQGYQSGLKEKLSTESDQEDGNSQNAGFSEGGGGGRQRLKDLPCRLQVTVKGVEWFVYNRSAAYDAVLEGLLREEKKAPQDVGKQEAKSVDRATVRKRGGGSNSLGSDKASKDSRSGSPWTEKSEPGTQAESPQFRAAPTMSQKEDTDSAVRPDTSTDDAFILRFLPIHIQCTKAAVVMGNENTKSVLIAKMESASGEVDASRSTGLDFYRQLINFQFNHPVVQMKPNDDYKEDQTTVASRVKNGTVDESKPKNTHTHSFLHRQRRRVWHTLQDIVPAFRSSVESFSSSFDGLPGSASQKSNAGNNWQGLSRYLDDNEKDDRARWSAIEYATVTTIADCSAASMCFYWDVGGLVNSESRAHSGYENEAVNINGDIPPEWGIKLSFKSSNINYGPWADRQRADIQRVFFPSLCKDATISPNLVPGQYRVPIEFKLYIEFDEDTTLRIPIREESKNWKWAKQADMMGVKPGENQKNTRGSRRRKTTKGNPGPEVRPFGWIDIKIGPNATISYVMDMVAGAAGFSNNFELDLPSIEITTSVNHGLLWRSVDNRIACDLSNPLKWNTLREWKFDIASTGLELFILREHLFLVTDLVEDWSSGPPAEYLTFVPFKYLVKLNLGDFRIYLNVNDANIINNPSDFEDNTYIIIFGSKLAGNICIPLNYYRPSRNAIPFSVEASNGGLNLHVPPWNTQATFLRTTEIATLNTLSINGTHQYCATTSSSNTDTVLLNVHGQGLSAQIYGFVIRYFLKVKDNYFGDDIRFKTLEEYQDTLHLRAEDDADVSSQQPPYKKSNDLDVILSIAADDSNIILPSNLYSAKKHTRIEISSIAADTRFTNYYMDLDVVLSSLAFSQGSEEESNMTPISATSSTQLFVDGVTASGNRLFGLPPTEPTYICNWDFAVGPVSGECTTEFFTSLASGARAFAFSFDDDENALPMIAAVAIHDVTFLRASVESVRVWLHVDEAAFLLSTGTITVGFNDLAGSHYSKKLNLDIPDLHIACVDAESASRHRSRAQHPVETHAFVQTSISFTMIQRVLGFENDRLLQQEHVKRHDQRTHRADFLLRHGLVDDSVLIDVDMPAQCVPPLPLPVPLSQSELDSMRSDKSSTVSGGRRLRHKGSFLSISASSQSDGSIIRPQSSLRKHEAQTTNSRSRSLQTSTGPGRRIPLRDVSASTGRHSSFYSAVGEHRGLPPSSVTFSSSYIAPYFPLEGVEPDTRDLPNTFHALDDSVEKDLEMGLEDVAQDRVAENSTHISFILQLTNGVRGVINPEAVHAVADLLSAVQAVDPDDLLDNLQIDFMNQIFDLKRQKLPKGQVIDFCVRIPFVDLRFLSSSKNVEGDLDSVTHDQYDVSVSGLVLTMRSETAVLSDGAIEGARESSTAHLSLTSASFSAHEKYCNIDDSQVAINGSIEDVVFWLVSGEAVSSSLAFQGFEIATASNKIEYLATLLHRTEALGREVAETFSLRLKQQRNRVRLFIFLVATTGQKVGDPLFLTRPSYVLRSATEHLRTSDSWKIVTRLHHMFTSLEPSSQKDIAMQCSNNTQGIPPDARQRVHASFSLWRSWDLDNINGCLIMAKIYGTGVETPETTEKSRSIKFSLRTADVRFLLDPGPKENEILLSDITAAFETKTLASTADIDPQSLEQMIQCTTIEVTCDDASIKLNWELLELADDIAQFYRQQEVSSETSSQSEATSMTETHGNKQRQELHVLIVTNKGSIIIDTINIRAASISKGLNASFVMVNHANEDYQNTISLMLAAEAVTSKVKTRSQDLTVFQLRHPSIYASYETQVASYSQTSTIKIAGNCRELSFHVQQDILAIVEVFDTIIGDEIAQLHRLKEAMPKSKSTSSQPTALQSQNTIKLNIALFLDQYNISVPLLQTLTYKVSGVVARASVAAQVNSDVVFDFDIKEHSHDIQTVQSHKSKSISLLQMPPTNGRVTYSMSDEENVLAVFASIEPIELDAAAVHSILTALNRPEISSVVADIQDDVKIVQQHLDELFIPIQTQSSKPAQVVKTTPFIYEAHMTLAGFNVFANAQSGLPSRKTARLDFNLGCVEIIVINRPENPGPIFDFPQIRIKLREITFELSRWNDNVMEPCGNLSLGALLTASSKLNGNGDEVKSFHLKSDGLEVNLYADTASSVLDVVTHLQQKIKDIDLSREKQYLQKLRQPKPRISINDEGDDFEKTSSGSTIMFASTYSLELLNIRASWLVGTYENNHTSQNDSEKENLVLSLKRVHLSTKTENAARLTIEDLLLQMATSSQSKMQRSLNSALLPEIIFNVGYVSSATTRRMAAQAAGKSLDLRLTSQFMKGVSGLKKSIGTAVDKVKAATATWSTVPPIAPTETNRRQPFFGKKRMESLLVDADFAGAVVFFSGKQFAESNIGLGTQGMRIPQTGKYGQFTNTDANGHTALRSPGLAFRVEYSDNGLDDPSLNAEVKVDASSNILYPSVVPLITEVSASLKEMVNDDDHSTKAPLVMPPAQKFMSADEDNLLTADPSAVLGRTRLNLGLRICRQEFTLSCQPIARVSATARSEYMYVTINTVRSSDHGHFFAVSATFTKLQASIQHVYSRDSTGSFDVDSVFLSLMNSKHLSGTSGLSAILKISPMKVLVNAKQLQDFLLFREIWIPAEIRQASTAPNSTPVDPSLQSQTFLVQRYQQVAATGAFPWNATVSIAELDVRIDLGQAIGKSVFMISNFWISSKKSSDWEQNLCLGFEKVGVDSTGRMSGFIALQNFKMRTSIQWPDRAMALNQTPLVQGSVSLSQLRIKAAFDYQAFLVADITSLRFLMYNVRDGVNAKADRLVAMLDGEAVQVFCTTATASQALALYQAFQRLVQEKRSNYEASLAEIERFMKRKSVAHISIPAPKDSLDEKVARGPISLHTDVIVTLRAVNIGAFPNTFSDHQVFKLEALDAQARFAVAMEKGKVHSSLGLTLGQLRIGLAAVKRIEVPRTVGDLSVDDVVNSATGSRGGTILKVPKVEATMQTWQVPSSNHIDYIFKSSFEGKVEVGWNYSRISYIRGMWASHSKALAQKLGKPLPPSAVKITGVPGESDVGRKDGEQQKITAEVNMPQSKYDYNALEPPIIETPQLRDMGEATPPLEWIGLHRDRLPNLTHQIVIVTLLELASEVEDAYAKILGSS